MINTQEIQELGFTIERVNAYAAIFTGHNMRITLSLTPKKPSIQIYRVGQSCPLFHTDFYTKDQLEALVFATTRLDHNAPKKECDHPFAYVMSKCNGELNTCYKCMKDL